MKFDEVFMGFITQYTKNNFSYEKTILLLKYFYYYSSCLIDDAAINQISKGNYFAKFIENNFNWVKISSVNFNDLFHKIVSIRVHSSCEMDNLLSFGNIFDIVDNYLNSFHKFQSFSKNKNYSDLFLSEKSIVDLISLQLENDKYLIIY